jgi:hypothetical protein
VCWRNKSCFHRDGNLGSKKMGVREEKKKKEDGERGEDVQGVGGVG